MKPQYLIIQLMLVLSLCFVPPVLSQQQTGDETFDADYHLVLWDNTIAPHSNGVTGEMVKKGSSWLNISKTEMWIYKADPEKATGKAVIYFPGGGYLHVGNGMSMCKRLAAEGITSAWVRYRLPEKKFPDIPREDGEKALSVLRSMAGKLAIDSTQVGVMGSSAGGYLAASLGTVSKVKPDFMILLYPVISGEPEICDEETFEGMFGHSYEGNRTIINAYSLEKHVDATTPPAIIFHSDDDDDVDSRNSTNFYNQMKVYKIPATLYIYPVGGHGWAGRSTFPYRDSWFNSALDWMSYLPAKAR